MIFFGPADFSQGIGVPCKFDDQRIAETRELVAKTAKKYGKFAGTVGSSENIAEYAAMGYQFVNVVSDVTTLSQVFIDTLNKTRNALENN